MTERTVNERDCVHSLRKGRISDHDDSVPARIRCRPRSEHRLTRCIPPLRLRNPWSRVQRVHSVVVIRPGAKGTEDLDPAVCRMRLTLNAVRHGGATDSWIGGVD